MKTGALQGKRLISVVTACYNEEENVEDVYREIKKIRDKHSEYKWEHIFIDNASTDSTVSILKSIVEYDKDVKSIMPIVEQINKEFSKFKNLSNDDLRDMGVKETKGSY